LRPYEIIYILDPALTEEQIAEAVQRFVQVAKDQGAEVDEPQRWPKRRLAYHIKGKGEGFYVVMTLRAEPPMVREVARVLKLAEPVLRHMVISPEEKKRPAQGAGEGVQ